MLGQCEMCGFMWDTEIPLDREKTVVCVACIVRNCSTFIDEIANEALVKEIPTVPAKGKKKPKVATPKVEKAPSIDNLVQEVTPPESLTSDDSSSYDR